MNQRTDIPLSLPSKGRLAEAALGFLAACGLEIAKPNPRQYAAGITITLGHLSGRGLLHSRQAEWGSRALFERIAAPPAGAGVHGANNTRGPQ